MILPFTTNEWNAVRFVVLNLVCVPLIELALHKCHQLRTGHRILKGKPARLRQSRLGNWGLHQEVDELSRFSKFTLITAMISYVGLSLYTEYASGSIAAVQTWAAPVSRETSGEGKPAFYDTNLAAGCWSKASRMKVHRLWEAMAFYKVLDFSPAIREHNTSNYHLLGTVSFRSDIDSKQIYDNGSHLLFFEDANRERLVGSMDNKTACLRERGIRGLEWHLECFSTSENITVMMLIGNAVFFPDLGYSIKSSGRKLLLPSHAFESRNKFESFGDGLLDKLQKSRSRDEYRQNREEYWKFALSSGCDDWSMAPKYRKFAAGPICQEEPKIEPRILRIPQKARIGMAGRSRALTWSMRKRESIGLIGRKLIAFSESRNSTFAFCGTGRVKFFAMKTPNGSTILGRFDRLLPWTLSWEKQDFDLADLARGALVSHHTSVQQLGDPRYLTDWEEAETIAVQLQQGIPIFTQIGAAGVTYNIRSGERATVVTWVLVLWLFASLCATCFLLFTKFVKPRLLPDVEFLYRQSVMQKNPTHSSSSGIHTPPTVTGNNNGDCVQLHISYANREVENCDVVRD